MDIALRFLLSRHGTLEMKSYLYLPALAMAIASTFAKGAHAQAQFFYVTGVRNYKVRITKSCYEIKLRKFSAHFSGSGRDPNGLEEEEGYLRGISNILANHGVSHVQQVGHEQRQDPISGGVRPGRGG